METRRALILAARRTPIGRAGGYFDRLEEYQLLGPVIDAVLEEAGAPPESGPRSGRNSRAEPCS